MQTQLVSTPNLIQEQLKLTSNFGALSYTLRIKYLRALKMCLQSNEMEEVINKALEQDLGRKATENFFAENMLVLAEIDIFLKNLHKWMQGKRFSPTLTNPFGKGYVVPQAKGLVLIFGAWNYPIQLTLLPLIGAIAAGNRVALKPSEHAMHCAKVIEKIVRRCFPEEVVTIHQGDTSKAKQLLEFPFDHIFFTGSTSVGRTIALKAAETLTPTTLELGGKSPVIVDETINISMAAKRILWAKSLNAGQSCIAPDYLLITDKAWPEFRKSFEYWLDQFFPNHKQSLVYGGKILNTKHFQRLQELKQDCEILYGGEENKDQLQMMPTLLKAPNDSHAILQDEIFGPLLPVLNFKSSNDIHREIKKRPNPLACYLFSANPELERNFEQHWNFGGGCIGDCMMHPSDHNLPFGGLRTSGQGRYHGQYSFDCFSHQKGILKAPLWYDPPFRYPPYSSKALSILKRILT